MEIRNAISGLLKDIKSNVKEYASKSSDLIIGEVVSVDPLKVKINVSEGTLVLDEEFLTKTTLVVDFEVDVDIEFDQNSVWTEPKEDPNDRHAHRIKGTKSKQKLKVYLGLKQGEKVILIRVANGQHYLVLDRLR